MKVLGSGEKVGDSGRSGGVDDEDGLLARDAGEDDRRLGAVAGLAPDLQLAAQLVVVQPDAALLDRQPRDAVLGEPRPQGPAPNGITSRTAYRRANATSTSASDTT